MTRNGEKMTLNLTRIEVCDLLVAALVAADASGAEKWMPLHDKILTQLNAFDAGYDKRRAEENKGHAMTVRELIAEMDDIDIDVCDDYDERCYIAFCGGYKLTDAGIERFRDALDVEVTIRQAWNGYKMGTLHCETAREAQACADLFNSLAGWCSADDFDIWFEEV